MLLTKTLVTVGNIFGVGYALELYSVELGLVYQLDLPQLQIWTEIVRYLIKYFTECPSS